MSRTQVLMAVFAGAAAAAVVGAGLMISDDGPSRQRIVSERGAGVMPFDLEATTHVFERTETGGDQTVAADNPTDSEQIELIRVHLREEQQRFQAGDFGDPTRIHGEEMPGVAVLQANVGALETNYQDRPAGGAIIYRSSDPVVVAALHDWFDAQLSDHGSHAEDG